MRVTQSSVGSNGQECATTHSELSPPPPLLSLSLCLSLCLCVSDFPNPFSSSSQQPVALSPSNPFSNASGGETHVLLAFLRHFLLQGGKCSPHAFSSGLLTMLYSLFLRRWRWQEKKKVLRAHNSRLIEHKGQLYACFMRGFAVFVFFLYCFKLNIFGFWTVGQTEKDSGRWHLEYIRAPFLIFRNQNQENKMNISCGPQWLL